MDTSLDIKFAESSESIVTQLGLKDLKSFIKNQASLMLMARLDAPGVLQHVMARGIERRKIFWDDKDSASLKAKI